MEINWGVINQLIERKKSQPKKCSSVRQGLGHIVQPPDVLGGDTLLIYQILFRKIFHTYSEKLQKLKLFIFLGIHLQISQRGNHHCLFSSVCHLYILFECTAVTLYHKIIIHVDHLPDRAFQQLNSAKSCVYCGESSTQSQRR